jgi:hypothetical protein
MAGVSKLIFLLQLQPLVCLRLSSALKNPLRPKTLRGAPITISGREEPRIADFQHINNAWPP